MGMEALLSGRTLASAVKWCGITHGRLDIHPTRQTLVLSIARKGKIHQVDVPIGITLMADEICELLTRPPASAIAQTRGEIPTAPDPEAPARFDHTGMVKPAATDPEGSRCKPFGPDGPDYQIRILGHSPP